MILDRRRFLFGAGAAIASAGLGCGGLHPIATRLRPIVIVGAGLSGLVIAHELVKHGHDVMVIEATARPGGRIRTIRGFPEGLSVEAGATHVVGDPDLVALIDELGLISEPRPKRVPLAHVRYAHGERQVYPPGADGPPDHELSAEELQLDDAGRIQRYFNVVDRIDPHSMTWSDELMKLDQMTCADHLRGQGASPGMIADIADTMPIGDGLESESALDIARVLAAIRHEMTLPPRPGNGRIAGGADALPNSLAARLGDRITYNTALERIEHTAHGATLVVADRTGRHRLEAARVVLTMPFTVLRDIDVAPRWSPLKGRAIAELDMTSVTRIWVATDRRSWIDRGEAGRADSDLSTGTIRDESELQPATTGILGVYTSGARARRLAELTPAARIAALTADVARVHPDTAGHVVHGDSIAWETERYSRGAYAAFKPGQLTTLSAAASAPEGVIHFAGCGTSHRPGFMHGAIASAKRVIAELRTSVR